MQLLPVSRRSDFTDTRVGKFLAWDRNVGAIAGATFLMTLGEELWKRFLPKYLEALGAPVLAIGLYGSTKDLLDGLYQYPGGWVADHFGRRRALLAFVGVALIGYLIVAAAPSWPVVFIGLICVMAWASMGSPVLFAVIGDALPSGRRAMGFSVQSILRRIPMAVAPTLGGLLIAGYGVRQGVRLGLVASVVLAAVTLLVASSVQLTLASPATPANMVDVWRALPVPLRRLLLSDVFIRTCEGLVDVFLVLYVLNVLGLSATHYGVLVGVQMTTSMLSYLPAARLADRVGRKPLVIATFLAFAVFPIAVILSHSFETLLLAYFVGGLREIGEPARKALIVDLAPAALRARSVGLYYLVRSVAISPAASIGGVLWTVAASLPFILAGAVGLVGTAIFALTVDERYAA